MVMTFKLVSKNNRYPYFLSKIKGQKGGSVVRIITFYKLKKDSNREEFKKFIKEKDIPAGLKLPYVRDYIQTEIEDVQGLDIDSEFVEIWDIGTDRETWLKKEWKNKKEFEWLQKIDEVAVSFVDTASAKTIYLEDL